MNTQGKEKHKSSTMDCGVDDRPSKARTLGRDRVREPISVCEIVAPPKVAAASGFAGAGGGAGTGAGEEADVANIGDVSESQLERVRGCVRGTKFRGQRWVDCSFALACGTY